jgi:hypothetical protein
MPAFLFEKIAPPVHRTSTGISTVAIIKERRSVVVQMIDRITESRLERESRKLRQAHRNVGKLK